MTKSSSPSSNSSSASSSQVVGTASSNPVAANLKSKTSTANNNPSPTPYRCDVCSVECNSNLTLASHLAGKQHLKAIRRTSGAFASTSPGWQSIPPEAYADKKPKRTASTKGSASSSSQKQAQAVATSKPKASKLSPEAKLAAKRLKEKEKRLRKERELLSQMPALQNRNSRELAERDKAYEEDCPPFCKNCDEENPQFLCSGCTSSFYCNNKCQQKDWLRFHHEECACMIDSEEECEREAWEIYREWYGYDLGNHGYCGGDD